jgi:hypothetical protein
MLERMEFGGSGSGNTVIDYKYVKKIVDTHTHTYDFNTNSCATLNAGGVYVDTENGVVYMYADFNLVSNVTVSTQQVILSFNPAQTGILPYDASNNVLLPMPILESTTATNSPTYVFFKNNSNTVFGTNKNVVSGTSSVVWAMWTDRRSVV